MENDIRHKKVVDSREPESIRTKLLETGWSQQALYTADFMFYTINFKSVGIERKSIQI